MNNTKKGTYLNIYQLNKSEEAVWRSCDSCGSLEDDMCEIVIGKGMYTKSIYLCSSCFKRLLNALLVFSKS